MAHHGGYFFFEGSFLRLVLAISRSCFSDIDLAICFEAPFRLDFFRLPRFAAKAAPAAICCFLDLAGIPLNRLPRRGWLPFWSRSSTEKAALCGNERLHPAISRDSRFFSGRFRPVARAARCLVSRPRLENQPNGQWRAPPFSETFARATRCCACARWLARLAFTAMFLECASSLWMAGEPSYLPPAICRRCSCWKNVLKRPLVRAGRPGFFIWRSCFPTAWHWRLRPGDSCKSAIFCRGASDHGVSEAIYLADPEGNGLELYSDRPPGSWPRDKSSLSMYTRPLDLRALLSLSQANRE